MVSVKKFLTFVSIASLILTGVLFSKSPGTQASPNVGYITANEFVTQLLTQAKVTPATWDKAVAMKLIPFEDLNQSMFTCLSTDVPKHE
ncbi:hypothetical protein Calkr_2650 (plasmid) [Caldicellulosiruptor acetigenus I77R1B]|uniref:Uncharacterized protein n=2 Tax=Caldicellulosiruptor acetigenus TaxID=301953 RepID=E4SAZ4_CALA7|nr:hypothetical protein Calkr_2650 [Caldicellulosiruptor acetigenus I77R1B]